MKKHLRMIAGIILHPVRLVMAYTRQRSNERIIRLNVQMNWEEKNHERMHRFDGSDFPDTSSFTRSPLYRNLSHGAF